MKRVSRALAAGGSWGRFWWHYVQMVIAMMVGMALTPLGGMLFKSLGAQAVYARPDVHTLVMATAMTIGMTVWMVIRRHGWRPIAEMAAAMYLPFIVLFPLLWAGVIDQGALSGIGHMLMLPAMAGVMLLRPEEYMMPHAHHAHATAHLQEVGETK
jgi:hypothetical protein